MGDNDDIRPYDELFSPGTVSNTKYLANGDIEGMEEKELKTKQIIDKLVDDYVACRITYDEFSKEMKSFYADGDESKPILKEFDLEAAKQGKPICTRDGHKARIICFDLKNKDYPIVAAIGDNHSETVFSYTARGEIITGNYESKRDLMMLPEKKEGWVNVYKERCYESKEEAIRHIAPGTHYIDTIKVEWEE